MNKRFVGIALLVLGMAIGVYWNSVHNEFVNMDDLDGVVRNKYIRSLSVQNIKDIFTPGVAGAYQPVRTLSYAIDYHFWKLNPVGYHLTNILCHAGSTLLVLLIGYRVTKDRLLSCLASLLFAVHPVHVEAVTWVSGRRDVLASVLVLLSFYCFLRFVRSTKPLSSKIVWYGISLIVGILGLLSKASAVVLLPFLLLCDVCFLLPHHQGWREKLSDMGKRVPYYLPFFLATLWFMQVFISVSRASGVARASYHGSPLATFLIMVRVFAEYVSMLCVPHQLSLTYGIQPVVSFWEPSFLLAVVVLFVIAGGTVLAWKRTKLVVFSVCWFFIGLGPVSNIIPISVVKADRYIYLPSVGFCLAIGWFLARCLTWCARQVSGSASARKLLLASYGLLLVGLIGGYAALTIERNRDWKDSETLWTATLETHPDSPIALNNLGLVYAARGEYEKAITLYEMLLEKHPAQHGIEMVYTNLGDAYVGMQMVDEAIDHYQHALEYNPEYVEAYLGLASVTADTGEYEKAAMIYQAALDFEPQNERIYNQLGNLQIMQGNYEEAESYYQDAIDRSPYYISAYNGLGFSYMGRGNPEKALAVYQQALQIDPTSAVIHNSLGRLYQKQGKREQAIAEFQEVLRHEPDNADVRVTLGFLYLEAEQYDKALQQLMEAVKAQPDNPQLISDLGTVYVYVGLPEEALDMYRWALELDPSLFRTHVLLGDVCLGTHDIACAIEAYQQALQLQPDNQAVLDKLQQANTLKIEN